MLPLLVLMLPGLEGVRWAERRRVGRGVGDCSSCWSYSILRPQAAAYLKQKVMAQADFLSLTGNRGRKQTGFI
jgi:hypothetical protein